MDAHEVQFRYVKNSWSHSTGTLGLVGRDSGLSCALFEDVRAFQAAKSGLKCVPDILAYCAGCCWYSVKRTKNIYNNRHQKWKTSQASTKSVSDSQGLVDVPVGQPDFLGRMPDGLACGPRRICRLVSRRRKIPEINRWLVSADGIFRRRETRRQIRLGSQATDGLAWSKILMVRLTVD